MNNLNPAYRLKAKAVLPIPSHFVKVINIYTFLQTSFKKKHYNHLGGKHFIPQDNGENSPVVPRFQIQVSLRSQVQWLVSVTKCSFHPELEAGEEKMTEGQNIPHQLNADFTKAPKLGLGENKLQSEMSSQHQTQGACHELQTLERSLISISCLSCASAA